MLKRKRRSFSDELKAQAVELVLKSGLEVAGVLTGDRDGHEAWRWRQRHRPLTRWLLDEARTMPFHASRHTAASFLLAQGADLRTVTGVLGHSQIALTANTYSHMLEELHVSAAVRSDAALKAARESAKAQAEAAKR